MTVSQSVAEVLREHVTLQIEGIDRVYLNAYVPLLQEEAGVAFFFKKYRGARFVSSAIMAPMTKEFVASIEKFALAEGVALVTFGKDQRKDDIAAQYRARFEGEEGILFVGKAQEKTRVTRTERRKTPAGVSYPWLVKSTAMVNHYYFYAIDKDFGPFFIKFGSYFPYNAKVCLNGHEYLKRQLAQRGIEFEALDNGLLRCDEPDVAQQICDELSAEKIETFFRKWLKRLPHPFSKEDRKAGMLYELSVLQAEFSLTQVLDRPVTGRVFFEEVIRENIDIGRPDQVQLIFDRSIRRSGRNPTPGRFRTRVITKGVTPSLHLDYKTSRIKQYHKEGRALRTETTINNTYDFNIGRRLQNLPALREVGFKANQRLLDVQRISHDCAIGEDAFKEMQRPRTVAKQRASALHFADDAVQALLHALVLFRLLPRGFSNAQLREQVQLLGQQQISAGRMSYDLRRLKLHGLIRRIPKSHRYEVTDEGLRTALFFTRAHDRLFRPALAELGQPAERPLSSPLRSSFLKLEKEMDAWIQREKLAA